MIELIEIGLESRVLDMISIRFMYLAGIFLGYMVPPCVASRYRSFGPMLHRDRVICQVFAHRWYTVTAGVSLNWVAL
jgi:hypothetical protein